MKTTKELELEVVIETTIDDDSGHTTYVVYVGNPDGDGLWPSTLQSTVPDAFHEALTEYLIQEKLKSL